MGMSIDEVIYCMNSYLPDLHVSDCINCKYYGSTEGFCCSDEAHQKAIDIMRKYQKIKEIINNTDYIQEDVIRYKMIYEVIEDGKID